MAERGCWGLAGSQSCMVVCFTEIMLLMPASRKLSKQKYEDISRGVMHESGVLRERRNLYDIRAHYMWNILPEPVFSRKRSAGEYHDIWHYWGETISWNNSHDERRQFLCRVPAGAMPWCRAAQYALIWEMIISREAILPWKYDYLLFSVIDGYLKRNKKYYEMPAESVREVITQAGESGMPRPFIATPYQAKISSNGITTVPRRRLFWKYAMPVLARWCKLYWNKIIRIMSGI